MRSVFISICIEGMQHTQLDSQIKEHMPVVTTQVSFRQMLPTTYFFCGRFWRHYHKEVQVGNDEEKAQSEKDSHSKIIIIKVQSMYDPTAKHVY